MRAYIITENEMELLHSKLEKYFRDIAERKNQQWHLSSLNDQPATVYDGYHAANYVIRSWISSISK